MVGWPREGDAVGLHLLLLSNGGEGCRVVTIGVVDLGLHLFLARLLLGSGGVIVDAGDGASVLWVKVSASLRPGVGGDERLSPADLLPLSGLTDGVVPHPAFL